MLRLQGDFDGGELRANSEDLIFTVARRITGILEDAEEVLVDTFHQAWAQAHDIDVD